MRAAAATGLVATFSHGERCMSAKSILLTAGLLFGMVGSLVAQEVQVPLDQAGRVEVVDARLAERLGLFLDEYPGFREARLFRLADSSFVLEVTVLVQGQTARLRRPLTAAQAGELRRQVTERLAERAPGAALDQDGRFLFLLRMLPLGLGFYGPGVPIVLGVDDGAAIAGTYLLSAGGAFFLPYYLTRNRSVTYGQGVLGVYGATRGAIFHTSLLERLLFGKDDAESYPMDPGYDEEPSSGGYYSRRYFALGIPLTAAEAVGGMIWAGRTGMTAGHANAIKWMGDVGMATGALLGGMMDLEYRGRDALILASSAVGIVGGDRLARRRAYTYADADLMGYTGILGVLTGLTVLDWFTDAPSSATIEATVLAGLFGGLAVGDLLVQPTDFTINQSIIIAGGSIAGGLVGTGIMLLLVGDAKSEPIFTAATAGALTGFGVTYAALAPDARRFAGGTERSGIELAFSPLSMLKLLEPDGGLAGMSKPLPVFQLKYRF